MDKNKIAKAQKLLKELGLSGWLLYDFRRSNPLACHFLELPDELLLTRRFFYWIPKEGAPIKFVSAVENPLKSLEGEEVVFRSWGDLESYLSKVLKDSDSIAMEYSPFAAIPEISRVDGGTIDWIRKMGPKVVSSGDLLGSFSSVWDEQKWISHQKAADFLDKLAGKTWDEIAQRLSRKEIFTEYDIERFMHSEMIGKGFETSERLICATNAHSADPHYIPEKVGSSIIKEGDWILIDLWCKEKKPGAVFGDITRVGVARNAPTPREVEIFSIVKNAQDAAIAFVKERYESGQKIQGFEVDHVCRAVIDAAGYGNFFVHRTGHNIDTLDHGPGTHIDDLETHDVRLLLKGTCFSIEPGIYLPGEFGVRLEVDLFLHPDGHLVVTGGLQEKIHVNEGGRGGI